MKINKWMSALLLFLTAVLFSAPVLAKLVLECEDLNTLCQYEGKYHSVAEANKEFLKLVNEKPTSEYFQTTYIGLARIMQCADMHKEYMDTMLDGDCKVYGYMKKFVKFYELYKEEIAMNLEEEDPDFEVTDAFDVFVRKYKNPG